MNKELLEKRQAIIDKYFPGDNIGMHKFSAETGKCQQCSIYFADWATTKPVILLCPIIGQDEVDLFRIVE